MAKRGEAAEPLLIDRAAAAESPSEDSVREWAREKRAFLSSVMADMGDERRAAAAGVRAAGLRAVLFEEFGGRDADPEDAYLKQSHIALGHVDDALRDLQDILQVADIAPEQKTEARLRRGMMYMELGRNKEAEVDLQTVCATNELFRGTLASSLVALGELARRREDVAETREYLEVATSSEDADDETVVESLIVWARALSDQGAVADAERIWQGILANPHATERQRSLAEESAPYPE